MVVSPSVDSSLETLNSTSDYYRLFVGDQVAVIGARYQYWGVLAAVLDKGPFPSIIIANAHAVERSGPSSGEKPEITDPIGGSICLSMNAIEIFYQPPWSRSKLD